MSNLRLIVALTILIFAINLVQVVYTRPVTIYKYITRQYEVNPLGHSKGICNVRLEIFANTLVEVNDTLLFVNPKSFLGIGVTPKPNYTAIGNFITTFYWNVYVNRKITIQYQIEPTINFIEGYCRVSINGKRANFTKINESFILRVNEGDIVKVEYFIKNIAPLAIKVRDNIVKVVLPIMVTLSIDENKIILRNVTPSPNISSKLGGTKILVWFTLLNENTFNITIEFVVKDLGIWREIKFEPINILVDLDVDKYIDEINSNIEKLQGQFDRIEEYLSSYRKLLDIYMNYSSKISNLTQLLEILGNFLCNNVSQVLFYQAKLMEEYARKLDNIITRAEEIRGRVERLDEIVNSLLNYLLLLKELDENITNVINATTDLANLLNEYNISEDVINQLIITLRTLKYVFNTSKTSTMLIVDVLKDFNKTLSYGKISSGKCISELKRLKDKLTYYSNLQWEFGRSLYSLGENILLYKETMERATSKVRILLANYTEKFRELLDLKNNLTESINKLYKLKLGLLALKLFGIIECNTELKLPFKIRVMNSYLVIEVNDVDKIPKLVPRETIEITLASFHLTSINQLGYSQKLGQSRTNRSSTSFTRLIMGLLLLVMFISTPLLVIQMIHKLRNKIKYKDYRDELLKRIKRLMIVLENELSRS